MINLHNLTFKKKIKILIFFYWKKLDSFFHEKCILTNQNRINTQQTSSDLKLPTYILSRELSKTIRKK